MKTYEINGEVYDCYFYNNGGGDEGVVEEQRRGQRRRDRVRDGVAQLHRHERVEAHLGEPAAQHSTAPVV